MSESLNAGMPSVSFDKTHLTQMSSIIDQMENELRNKLTLKMNDPKATDSSLMFYIEGFNECLDLLKEQFPQLNKTIPVPKAAPVEKESLISVQPKPHDIKGFQGQIFGRDHKDYKSRVYQYAFSSVQKKFPGMMKPKYILYPLGDDDIKIAIAYAREKKCKIAVRTGGHQYCGASSTNGENILLDLSETYLEFATEDNGLVKTGVSHALREFNSRLGKKGMFVPHGQCSHVHLGGHVQTGGYGQLGRSFGLFADHVEKVRLITADGTERIIDRNTQDKDEQDLFYGVMGGSPGNFGVLTHLWVRPHKDSDHPESRGLKSLYIYSKEKLKSILDFMVKMNNNEDMPRNYDLCVTVISAAEVFLPHIWPNIDEQMKKSHPNLYGKDTVPAWGPMILLYAQYADFGKFQEEKEQVMKWFEDLTDAAGWPVIPHQVDYKTATKMSELTKAWIFGNVREFLLPFEKRTYMTNWTDKLVTNNWTEWVSTQVDEIQSGLLNGCKLSVQIQPFGGKNSQFRVLNDGKTAYSWRDSTICCVLDCFYKGKWNIPGLDHIDPFKIAQKWQHQNDEGSLKHFCDQDRRVLWGSHDYDLAKVESCYYEKGKWETLIKIKQRWDPEEIFTPNKFGVQTKPESHAPPILAAVTHEESEFDENEEANMAMELLMRHHNYLANKQGEDISLEESRQYDEFTAKLLREQQKIIASQHS